MKILYVLNDTLNYGGTEAVVLNYYRNIDKENLSIDFLLHTTKEECESNELCQKLRGEGANIMYVPPRKQGVRENYRQICHVLEQHQYDIVHAHMDCVGALFLSIAKKKGIKVRIAHSHNTDIPIKKDSLKSILHYCFLEYCRYDIRKQATHYMACSKAAGVWLFGKKNMKKGKVYILHNAINTEKFIFSKTVREEMRESLGLKEAFVVGHVGRLSRQKNHAFLFQVFKEVLKHKENARLLLVGEGELRTELETLAKQLKIEKQVIFYGATDKVSDLLQTMDVFVFPSLFEGLGVALVEVQASGVTSIVSQTVPREVELTDRITWMSLNQMPSEWGEQILKLDIEHQNCIEQIKNKGYDIKLEAKKLETYYQKVFENSKG